MQQRLYLRATVLSLVLGAWLNAHAQESLVIRILPQKLYEGVARVRTCRDIQVEAREFSYGIELTFSLVTRDHDVVADRRDDRPETMYVAFEASVDAYRSTMEKLGGAVKSLEAASFGSAFGGMGSTFTGTWKEVFDAREFEAIFCFDSASGKGSAFAVVAAVKATGAHEGRSVHVSGFSETQSKDVCKPFRTAFGGEPELELATMPMVDEEKVQRIEVTVADAGHLKENATLPLGSKLVTEMREASASTMSTRHRDEGGDRSERVRERDDGTKLRIAASANGDVEIDLASVESKRRVIFAFDVTSRVHAAGVRPSDPQPIVNESGQLYVSVYPQEPVLGAKQEEFLTMTAEHALRGPRNADITWLLEGAVAAMDILDVDRPFFLFCKRNSEDLSWEARYYVDRVGGMITNSDEICDHIAVTTEEG